MNLTEAFHKGKQVAYKFTPWNDITPTIRFTEQRWSDISAQILQSVLAELPHQKDELQRMETAQAITKSVMGMLGKELS